MLNILLFCVFSYLMGSLSSAIIVCRLAGLPDPRLHGSENPGATNVLRLGGKRWAGITWAGDVLKGWAPVFAAGYSGLSSYGIGAVMVAAFLGHLYPIFFKFQGGKGGATAWGGLLAFAWPVGLLFGLTWGIILFLFRISSLAALVAVVCALIYSMVSILWTNDVTILANGLPVMFMGILIFWRHRKNIQRLMKGTEPKIGAKL